MKFFAAVVAAVVVLAEAKKTRVNRDALLRKATKVTDRSILQTRKLSGYAQVTSDQSIQFNSCISLTTEPADNDIFYSENNVGYAESGNIVSQKSYILFNVCETDYCDYMGDEDLYMIDLQSYLTVTMPYLPTRKARYCQTCENSQQYCEQEKAKQQAYEEQEDQGEWYEDEENMEEEEEVDDYQDAYQEANEYQDAQAYQQANGNYRQLNWYGDGSGAPKGVETVTCEKCEELGCFGDDYGQEEYDENDYQQYDAYQQNDAAQNEGLDDETISQWAMNMIGCQESGYYWNDDALYASFMCNADGTGVEIGLFLDQDCTIYTNLASYSGMLQDNGDYNLEYAQAAQEVVSFPFTHDIDCGDFMSFATPWGTYQQNAYYQNSNKASQFCSSLFQGYSFALDACDPNEGDDQAAEYNDYAEAEADEYYEEYQEADGAQYYDFYTYLISQEELYYPVSVCKTIKSLEGEYTPVFDGSHDSLFDYSDHQKYSPRLRSVETMRSFGIYLIVALVVVAVVGGCYMAYPAMKETAINAYPALNWSPDPKKEKLVINDKTSTPAPSVDDIIAAVEPTPAVSDGEMAQVH